MSTQCYDCVATLKNLGTVGSADALREFESLAVGLFSFFATGNAVIIAISRVNLSAFPAVSCQSGLRHPAWGCRPSGTLR